MLNGLATRALLAVGLGLAATGLPATAQDYRRDDAYRPQQDDPYRRPLDGTTRTTPRDDAYRPQQRPYAQNTPYGQQPYADQQPQTYQQPYGQQGQPQQYQQPYPQQYQQPYNQQGQQYGEPYPQQPRGGEPYTEGPRRYGEPYTSGPQPYDERDRGGQREEQAEEGGSFSSREIMEAGHSFFGSVSKGLASVVEHAFKSKGRPNGYILGQDAGGALVAGLRYGEGVLYTKDAGTHRVYWQGPSIGWDAGAEGSKVMVLVYNLRNPEQIYQRFAGVAGSAYLVGGVGITFQESDDIVVAPIRAGVGLRFGANVGYLKYTRRPTWNPF